MICTSVKMFASLSGRGDDCDRTLNLPGDLKQCQWGRVFFSREVLVTDEFTTAFENHWNDFRARWCDSFDLGGARAFSHKQVKTVMLHRVTQVDVPASDTGRLIAAAVQFYREKCFDCAVTLTPLDRPADLAERLQRRGFELVLMSVAMLRDQPADHLIADGIADDVRVDVANAGQYDVWADVMCRCFGNPPALAELGRTVLDVPEVRLYLAYRGDDAAGTALLYSANGMGYVDLVGTLPEHRRQGVAAAIVARISQDSTAMGNRWTALEVESDSSAEGVYRRCGFRRMHFRPRYVKKVQ